MRKISQEEFNQILEDHKKWLAGTGGSRADLSHANLSETDLVGADLRWTYLVRANLRGANLSVADLSGADLFGANLRGADLSGANLRGADLTGACLSGADLSVSDLTGAKLDGADLDVEKAEGVKGIDIDIMREVSRHRIVRHGDVVCIGCQTHSLDYWLEHYADLGRKYKYSEEEIEEYGSILKRICRDN